MASMLETDSIDRRRLCRNRPVFPVAAKFRPMNAIGWEQRKHGERSQCKGAREAVSNRDGAPHSMSQSVG
jgi:hypothetical protein